MAERISDVTDPPDEMLPFLTGARADGRRAPGTIRLLAHRPAMWRTFLAWASVLAREGALPRRDHEILALRASLHGRSSFEWGEHVEFALVAGLTDAEIDAIVSGPLDPIWRPFEAALLRAADQLFDGFDIDDETWAALAKHYDEPQLVELVYVVGQYAMLSMVANALRVEVPPTFRSLPVDLDPISRRPT